MALKDWKVYHKNSSITTWIKKKDAYGTNPHLNGTTISVMPSIGEWINGKWKKQKTFKIEIDNKGYGVDTKRFKTKSQALKYAKAYMRKY